MPGGRECGTGIGNGFWQDRTRYERRAYTGREDSGIRITFDRDIRWRTEDLDLRAGTEGSPVLEDGSIVMEVKLPRAAPLWLVSLLSGLQIYPVSFSKYGTCYQKYLAKNIFRKGR